MHFVAIVEVCVDDDNKRTKTKTLTLSLTQSLTLSSVSDPCLRDGPRGSPSRSERAM